MKRTLIVVLFLMLAFGGTLAYMRSRPRPGGTGGTPTILFFAATPQEIIRGETVTLDWETQNVPTVAVKWGPSYNPDGNLQTRAGLPPVGSLTFQPQRDTIYVLECETTPPQMCMESASVHVR
jgi:hypothetical protein